MGEDLDRYEAAFGEPFPMVAWSGLPDQLREAVDLAIERGEPWAEGDLLEWQGLERPPEDAKI